MSNLCGVELELTGVVPKQLDEEFRVFNGLEDGGDVQGDEEAQVFVGEEAFGPVDVAGLVEQGLAVRPVFVEAAENVVGQETEVKVNYAGMYKCTFWWQFKGQRTSWSSEMVSR